MQSYPRDLIGYGRRPPDPQWPGGAYLAVEFVLAYETGAEMSVLHGDAESESVLTDLAGAPAVPGARSMLVESTFEFGSRVGIWRLLDLFEARGIKISALPVAMALQRNPAVADALIAGGHEIISHGWRWIDYQTVAEAVEKEHIRLSVDTIATLTGQRPLGWITGRPSPNTRRLLTEEGGFLYDQDCLNDELPHWARVGDRHSLVLPYSFETNDNAFSGRQGFATGEEFFVYLRDAFDVLYREGRKSPRMMTVVVHDRLTGRPGRAAGFERFLDHVLRHPGVWICRGIDVARHWMAVHPNPDGE
ncbi:polysaccharide deacetylase family protein [Rhizobium lusitanum]|uniref:polysaccharide deacetylase family protein n=1 Tax=Rhizobium lusitanum TaxID=293958 RepID=UPI00195AB555|nr:polysaccharide deacetylase family protein [Rhizobium lusitanum]MBM7049229.1 polysaccharide deacetylase family protein [Rhizobium lusitanum]